MADSVLSAHGLGKTFQVGKRHVVALADIDLSLRRGECLAVVGESGSGKSTLANLILGVHTPTTGEIHLDNAALPAERQLAHRKRIQLVQQNPLSALNPKRSVRASLRLALDIHGIGTPQSRHDRVNSLLSDVGLDPALADRRPAALSGGQRQRVAIARALAPQADVIVLDEPTSALDVLVQARVLALLNTLRAQHTLSYLFITHDLAVVRNVADRVAVFENGRLVELQTTSDLFSCPKADCTQRLLAAVPVVSPSELALRDALSKRNDHDEP